MVSDSCKIITLGSVGAETRPLTSSPPVREPEAIPSVADQQTAASTTELPALNPQEADTKTTRRRVQDLKRAKKKTKRRKNRKKLPTPEEIAALKQQAAIARKYLRAKRRRDEAFRQLAEELSSTWKDVLTRSYAPWDSQWRIWLAVYSPEELEQAMYIAGSKYQAGHFDQYQAVAIRELLPYVSGILKRRREQSAGGECPYCGQPV